MPICKITGIESLLLLDPTMPNLFVAAWQQRSLLAQKRGTPIDDRALSPDLDEQWRPATLLQHHYLIRTLSIAQLAQQSAFIRLPDEVPNARR